MLLDDIEEFLFAFRSRKHTFKVHRIHVAAQVEVTRFVVDVCKTTRHTGSEVHAHATEYDHATTRHVFATMVTDAFRDEKHTGVTDAKAFAGETVDEHLATRSTVTDDVTGNDIVFGLERCVVRRANDDLTTAETLSHKVVDFTFKVKRNTRSEECTEALAGNTLQMNLDRIFRETLCTVVVVHIAGGFCTDCAVRIVDHGREFHRLAFLEGILHERDDFATVKVDEFFRFIILIEGLATFNGLEDLAKVEMLCLVEFNGVVHVEQVAAAASIVKALETKAGEDFTDFVGDEVQEVLDVFRFALEMLAEFRILRGKAHRALVRMAAAVHNAAERYEQVRGEAEFFGTEECADHDVTTSLELAIDLELHAATEVVQNESLFGFGDTEFPRQARMLDGSKRRCARTAIVTGNENDVCVSLGNTGRNRTDTDFRHELHGNTGLRVGVVQVVNELSQVFDGVNIVMRRRRNERNIRDGVTHTGHKFVHLAGRELTAFTGLCALSHLNLQILGMTEIVDRDTETARCNLADGGTANFTVRPRSIAIRVFTTFTAVAHGSHAVHGDSDGFVSFGAQGAKAHGARDKVLDDVFAGFDFGNIDRSRFLELEESAECGKAFGLVVNELGIGLELFVIAHLHCLAECGDGLRRPQMAFTFAAVAVLAAFLENAACIGKSDVATSVDFLSDFLEADSFDTACGSREVLVDKFAVETDGFEYLGAAVAAKRRNAHLRHDLEETLIDSLDVVGCSRNRIHVEFAVMAHVRNAFESKIRVDDRCSVTEQERKVHHFADFAGLHDQADFRADTGFDKRAVHASGSEERRHRYITPIDILVRKHDDVETILHGTDRIASKLLQSFFEDFAVTANRELHLENFSLEALVTDVFKAADFVFGHDRARNLDEVSLFRRFFENVAVVADVSREAHHEFFTNRVNRRVRHLGEQLLEIVEQRLRLVREHCKSGVVTHGAKRFCACLCHRLQNYAQVFGRISKTFLLDKQIGRNVGRIDFAEEAADAHLVFGDPAAIRLTACHERLHFGILQDTVIFDIEIDDFTRF